MKPLHLKRNCLIKYNKEELLEMYLLVLKSLHLENSKVMDPERNIFILLLFFKYIHTFCLFFFNFIYMFCSCCQFLFCTKGTPKICGSNEFTCNNGDCVPSKARCNGIYDCVDESDELSCPTGMFYFNLVFILILFSFLNF